VKKIAILSDIHGNILALKSVLQDFKKYEIKDFICCGDYIGYYYEPSAVVSCLQNFNKPCVVGNHDLALLRLYKMKNLIRTRFLKHYYKHHGSGLKIALETLNQEQLCWLENLPVQINLKFEDIQCSLFHGIPNSPVKYLYPNSSLKEFSKFMECNDSQLFVGGHSHHQFSKKIGQKLYINPGSVGQPRDIGGQAEWAILQIDGKNIKFDFIQSIYNFQAVVNQATKIDPHISSLQSILLRGLDV